MIWGYSYFITLLEHIKIWCNFQVIIYRLSVRLSEYPSVVFNCFIIFECNERNTVLSYQNVLTNNVFQLAVDSKWTRIYFLSFHLFAVIIILNIFTAFVLEIFILEYSFDRLIFLFLRAQVFYIYGDSTRFHSFFPTKCLSSINPLSPYFLNNLK